MNQTETVVRIVLKHYPETQAIYLFGTHGTEDEWPDSDVDIAVLLPPKQAKGLPTLVLSPCHLELADALGKEVDLLNARRVSTVFQKEIIAHGRLLYFVDKETVLEFEMMTLSLYQKLNEERKEILEEFERTGKAYDV